MPDERLAQHAGSVSSPTIDECGAQQVWNCLRSFPLIAWLLPCSFTKSGRAKCAMAGPMER